MATTYATSPLVHYSDSSSNLRDMLIDNSALNYFNSKSNVGTGLDSQRSTKRVTNFEEKEFIRLFQEISNLPCSDDLIAKGHGVLLNAFLEPQIKAPSFVDYSEEDFIFFGWEKNEQDCFLTVELHADGDVVILDSNNIGANVKAASYTKFLYDMLAYVQL